VTASPSSNIGQQERGVAVSDYRSIMRGGLVSGTAVDRPPLAALLMVSALFLLGLQDGIIKLVSSEVSLWQFQLLRAAGNIVLVLLLARLVGGAPRLRPGRPWAVALRSLLLLGAMILFFGGMPFLSLPEIGAGLYVFPLFVALLSALVLGEPVGPRRVAAIVAGFAGTLLILKPGTESFRPVALMPVAAAFCYACMILTTRRLCRGESPMTLAFWVAIAYCLVSALVMLVLSLLTPGSWSAGWPYLFTGWRPLALWVLALILFCSLLNLSANLNLAKAYQSAQASWLAPFDYSYLIFATFWGFVFWRTIPDLLTFLGMAMIAGAGIFVAWRERREAGRRRSTALPPAAR
jgi:drug/metabolite transporter (DMT)-like permease